MNEEKDNKRETSNFGGRRRCARLSGYPFHSEFQFPLLIPLPFFLPKRDIIRYLLRHRFALLYQNLEMQDTTTSTTLQRVLLTLSL